MDNKPTSVRFNPEIKQQLQHYAESQHKSFSAIIEEAAVEYLTDRQTKTTDKTLIDDYITRFTPLLEELKDV